MPPNPLPRSASSASAAPRRWSIPSASSPSSRRGLRHRRPSYDEADVVVVNTCGFIDCAGPRVAGRDRRGDGRERPGHRHRLPRRKRETHPRRAIPDVLAITGPQHYEQVMAAVHTRLPPAHDPFLDLVPPQGIKLTPRHYAYLKISEGCNHRCSFCIIPSMRGNLASRPVDDVLREAERLVRAGRAGAAGDLAGHQRLRRRHRAMPSSAWRGTVDQHALTELCAGAGRARRLGAAALRLPLSARRRGDSADGRRARCCPTSTSRSSTRARAC